MKGFTYCGWFLCQPMVQWTLRTLLLCFAGHSQALDCYIFPHLFFRSFSNSTFYIILSFSLIWGGQCTLPSCSFRSVHHESQMHDLQCSDRGIWKSGFSERLAILSSRALSPSAKDDVIQRSAQRCVRYGEGSLISVAMRIPKSVEEHMQKLCQRRFCRKGALPLRTTRQIEKQREAERVATVMDRNAGAAASERAEAAASQGRGWKLGCEKKSPKGKWIRPLHTFACCFCQISCRIPDMKDVIFWDAKFPKELLRWLVCRLCAAGLPWERWGSEDDVKDAVLAWHGPWSCWPWGC